MNHACCQPQWICGFSETALGPIPRIHTQWSQGERLEHLRSRISGFRMKYTVSPGLYCAGQPTAESPVVVSANYKLSFDHLRRALHGIDAWILVLDTQGINVWCAAGKGTFGTSELIHRIKAHNLEKIVNHRRMIVPQLGAPGIAAFQVKKETGFSILYGPLRAADLRSYIEAGYRATREMRVVKFPIRDRLILTPMELIPAFKQFPKYAFLLLLLMGLQPIGIQEFWLTSYPLLILFIASILAGAFFTPLFLPFLPFRSFALKGWIMGILCVAATKALCDFPIQYTKLLSIFSYTLFPVLSSYLALQFTGATTFTGMSGVKKELDLALPIYKILAIISTVPLVIFKLQQWGAT